MVSGFLARPDIILSTGATLHKAGQTEIETAAQAAGALRPIAWDAAGILFALGVIGVGSLAVPIMTTGAAYDLCQVLGWKTSLHARQAGGENWIYIDRLKFPGRVNAKADTVQNISREML